MPGMLPSPAVSVIGRHNSGKTTLVERLIAYLSAQGLDVGSVKHHGHPGFEIDIPGKDSYRHRQAGATETWIAAPGRLAMVKDIDGDPDCLRIVDGMPGHDIVIVEGYRLAGLPAIEVMRQENDRDLEVARAFYEASVSGIPLSCDILQSLRRKGGAPAGFADGRGDLAEKMPGSRTVAIASDITLARRAAANYGIPCFDIDDIGGIAGFLREHYARPRLSVAIQAGGESRRMGQSKALVDFLGRPLIMRVIERVAPVADEIVITTNEGERLSFLYDSYPHLDIRLVPDECDARGALPGLLTAFRAARFPLVAVVACDMAFVSADLIAREYGMLRDSRDDVCIPCDGDAIEPFHALYRRETCLTVCERAVSQGRMRPRSLLDGLQVATIDRAPFVAANPRTHCFVNANTPEELAAIEGLARETDR
ncbi:MAG: molybdopterin-guanine dinucleotide biosynthesis protein B [Eggerthellaceae bacterium]